MDLQAIRNHVREHLDIEQEDLSDTLLDDFIREGSHRIEQAERYWPFYQKLFPFQIPAGQVSVTLTGIASDLTEIAAVTRSDGRHLSFLGPHEFEQRRFTSQSGNVCYFTQWGDTISWGPAPSAATDVVIRGYRRPVDWVAGGAGEEPDMPVELHNTVALWALQQAVSQQDDPEKAATYERMFADELNLYRRRFTQANMTAPMVLSGNHRRTVLGRLWYDWEL